MRVVRDLALERDAADPLGRFRDRFVVDDPDHAKLQQAYRGRGETPHPGETAAVVTFRHKGNALLEQLRARVANNDRISISGRLAES